jgi:hypothetical protein
LSTDDYRKEAASIVAAQEAAEEENLKEYKSQWEKYSEEAQKSRDVLYKKQNVNNRHDWGWPANYYTYY